MGDIDCSAIQPRARRAGPGLLLAGAGILLYRTVALLARGARKVLQGWVVGLTILEMFLDTVTLVGAARWWRSGRERDASLPLRFGAAATLLHAARVSIFVVGRTGPWVDVDVRPERRADHRERWTWSQVVFAGVMSVLGVFGVLIVWRVRRRSTGAPCCAAAAAHGGGAMFKPTARGTVGVAMHAPSGIRRTQR